MRKTANTILIFIIIAASFSLAAVNASDSSIAAASQANVSIARQLRLKRKMMMGQSSLLAILQSNRQMWENCDEDQKQLLRERAAQFASANPDSQNRIIRAMEKFNNLSEQDQQRYRKRSQWLQKALSQLTPDQRAELKTLPPAQRAQKILSFN